jgi:hypothetical protein
VVTVVFAAAGVVLVGVDAEAVAEGVLGVVLEPVLVLVGVDFGVWLCLCAWGTDDAVIETGTVGMMPVRFSVAVGNPSVPPLGFDRVIVAVRVSANDAAAFRGTAKVAEAWPAAKLSVPDVAW